MMVLRRARSDVAFGADTEDVLVVEDNDEIEVDVVVEVDVEVEGTWPAREE